MGGELSKMSPGDGEEQAVKMFGEIHHKDALLCFWLLSQLPFLFLRSNPWRKLLKGERVCQGSPLYLGNTTHSVGKAWRRQH